jgi:hypothetical protein
MPIIRSEADIRYAAATMLITARDMQAQGRKDAAIAARAASDALFWILGEAPPAATAMFDRPPSPSISPR